MLVRDILLEAISDNPLSEGIAEITKSKLYISHSAVETSEGDVIEAEFLYGVIKTNAYLWDIKNQNRKKYYSEWYTPVENPYTFVGKKYFKGMFINFVLYRIFSWIKLDKIANNVINRANEKQLICSTVNARCRGIVKYWLTLPKDLQQFVIIT
jgi:hypothetical protein